LLPIAKAWNLGDNKQSTPFPHVNKLLTSTLGSPKTPPQVYRDCSYLFSLVSLLSPPLTHLINPNYYKNENDIKIMFNCHSMAIPWWFSSPLGYSF